MVFSHFRQQQSGHVIFLSMIMVLVSLGFTLGYLQFVMGQRFIHLRHIATTQANLNAIAGLGKIGNPFLLSQYFNADTTLSGEQLPAMRGYSDSVNCRFIPMGPGYEPQLESDAKGVAFFNGFNGEPIEVTKKVRVRYNADTFAKYMYFTDTEEPAPPWSGSYVSFGSGERLEGIVYSNDDITMSAYGCPEFVEGPNEQMSEVYTAGNFIMNSCSDGIFSGTHKDSADVIDWPPFTGHDRVKEAATWFINAEDLLLGPDDPAPDMLLMTEIEFHPGGFYLRQWPYSLPPYQILSSLHPGYESDYIEPYQQYYPWTYSHDFSTGGWGSFGTAAANPHDWYHYDYPDYPKPADVDLYRYEDVVADEGVIWIQGGQVRVLGEIRGRFTIATSNPTIYRTRRNHDILASQKNNIWITGDLRYEDSYTNGMVQEGSTNRLGLLSAANIIVANTRVNGAKNGQWGNSVVINAAMIAMDEAFQIHYWQNTTNAFNFLNGGAIKGDGQGQGYYGSSNDDFRGTVNIWGSVIQSKRGYLKRNNPGPYTRTIGYNKNYNYDYNLREFPPPAWPENRNADGSRNLSVAAFGEYIEE
ncbi:MAG: hypothetical protein U9Q77_11005 [Candidatus Marinimicrobia bacterium]|nr:hypothetical protein [Candidatus Neomarinimicrobiota bacterium]